MATCSSCECSAECADWYISAISEQRVSRSTSISASTWLPSMRASTTWKSASSRVRPPTSVRATAAASAFRCARSSAICASVIAGAQLLDHRRFEHRAHLEHLARLFHAGLGDEGAARRLQGDQPVAAELVQRLAHEGAADAEDVGDLLLGQLGARHQAALDDGGGDRFDDALRGPGLHAVRPAPPRPRGGARGLVAVAVRGMVNWRAEGLARYPEVYTLCHVTQALASRSDYGKTHHARARHDARLPRRRHGGAPVPHGPRRRGARCSRCC